VHGTTPTRRDIVEFCRGRIASFKIPDQMRFVDRLPADLGKVQHIRLRTETP
jgi:acyl-coenzyme A synthetase/AMP-(fatty) acid ligase